MSTKLITIISSLLVATVLAGCGAEPATNKSSETQKVTGTDTTSVPASKPRETGPGDNAPAWSGLDLVSGNTVEFPGVLDGRPAVLLFWATWCPYCKAFMPYAGEIQADYGADQVHILTFNAKERGRGDPKAYVDSLAFPLVAIAEADQIAEDYGVKFLPGLMVVDGRGKVVYRRGWTDLPAGQAVAAQWDGEVRAAIDKALGQTLANR